MVYPGNRRFLPQNDTQRTDCANYPSQTAETDTPPPMKTMEYIDKANDAYDALDDPAERKSLARTTGCKGTYSLRRAASHNRVLDTPVDPMHLLKNIVEHIVNLIAGKKDSIKVRKQEQQCKRFRSAWMKDNLSTLPQAPFCLSKEEIVVADERACSVCVPSGFDWKPRSVFGKNTGMKSHEWKQLATSGVLRFCLRSMLGYRQRHTLFQLFDVISGLCDEVIDSKHIDDLELRVHRVLALIERDFPLSLQVIVFHLLHHLPMLLRRFGPVYGFWMYPYERFNSWITRRVTNRRYPEATVMETYRLSEWAHFMEVAGKLPDGAASASVLDLSPQDTVCALISLMSRLTNLKVYMATKSATSLVQQNSGII